MMELLNMKKAYNNRAEFEMERVSKNMNSVKSKFKDSGNHCGVDWKSLKIVLKKKKKRMEQRRRRRRR